MGDSDGSIWPADWDGVQRVIETYYSGNVAEKMQQHWSILRTTPFDIVKGDKEEGPMTEEQYLAAKDTAWNARRFLSSALSLNKLFTGTGYTADERAVNGQGGTA